MTLEQIRALAAVVEEGSFHGAAARLGKTQSAISRAVRAIEETLGVELFDRTQYRSAPTPPALALYDKARAVLAESEALKSMARDLARGHEPEVVVAITVIAPLPPLVRCLSSFSSAHPHTRLRLSFEVKGGTLERVLDGDAIIGVTAVQTNAPELEFRSLGQFHLLPVATPQLMGGRDPKDVDDATLGSLTQFQVTDSSRHRDPPAAGPASTSREWLVSDLSITKRLILSGLGWGWLPDHHIQPEVAAGELVVLEGPGVGPMPITLNLLRNRRKPLGPLARELWDGVLLAYAEGPGAGPPAVSG